YNAPIYFATKRNPTAPIRDESMQQYGGFFQYVVFDHDNPVGRLEQITNEQADELLSAQVYGSISPIKGLSLSGLYALESTELDKGYLAPPNTYEAAGRGRAGRNLLDRHHSYGQVQLQYERSLGEHQLTALLGHSYEYMRSSLFGAFIFDSLPAANFRYQDLQPGKNFASGTNPAPWEEEESRKMAAFYGRLSYAWGEKIAVQASLRREGASNLGANHQWGLFPAASLSLNLAAITGQSWLPKTRFSYGVSGNVPLANYASLALVEETGLRYYYNGQFITISDVVQTANPDLRWETSRGWNLGLDIQLGGSWLKATVDIYAQQTHDLIQHTNLEVPGGISSRYTYNGGDIRSSGQEVSLLMELFRSRSSLSWSHRLVLGHAQTRLGSLSTDEFPQQAREVIGDRGNGPGRWFPVIYLQEGEKLGEIWGPEYVGIDPQGKWIFRDWDLDGTAGDPLRDIVKAGDAFPTAYWGWSSSLRWKSWSLDFLLSGATGHSLVNTYRYYYETPGSVDFNNLLASALIPDRRRLRDFARFSDYYVEKASYARLDYLSLGREFGASMAGIHTRWKVYLLVQNLFTLTAYEGVDPEVRLNRGSDPFVPGIELRNTYFPVRNWVLGVEMNL
ncbi:MAG: TonB-dependent receptor, partial [Bacteroidetes bacterium]